MAVGRRADIAGATSDKLVISNVGVVNIGFYSVRVSAYGRNGDQHGGQPDSRGAHCSSEAGDFNFDQGQRQGQAYRDDRIVSLVATSGIWAAMLIAGSAGRQVATRANLIGHSQVAAGKPNAHPDGLPRGSFSVTVNHVGKVGTTGANWYACTREFPASAKDYYVIGRLSSGGAPINSQLGRGYHSGQRAAQTLKKLGVFQSGRATAGGIRWVSSR